MWVLRVNIFIHSGASPKIFFVQYKPVCGQVVDSNSGVAEESLPEFEDKRSQI